MVGRLAWKGFDIHIGLNTVVSGEAVWGRLIKEEELMIFASSAGK